MRPTACDMRQDVGRLAEWAAGPWVEFAKYTLGNVPGRHGGARPATRQEALCVQLQPLAGPCECQFPVHCCQEAPKSARRSELELAAEAGRTTPASHGRAQHDPDGLKRRQAR
mmetsp:Transcript_59785/g.192419  ORF Transcript_59785/g.192419 Transcript_59785/m.192419 type:complete len:113 (+) Transcript_59785:14-352(+)